jgi:hypothetical protein
MPVIGRKESRRLQKTAGTEVDNGLEKRENDKKVLG